jgi:hypothetical protein
MEFPKAIAASGALADELQAKLSQPAEPPIEPAATPPDTPPAAEVQPAPTPTPATPIAPSADEDTWAQRFRTIQGKYNAEVPRLTGELKEVKDRLATATAEIERLLRGQQAADPAKTQRISEKDVEAFGVDLIDVIGRKAHEVAESMVTEKMRNLEAENQKLNDRLKGVTDRQGTSDRIAYFNELGRLVPDYEALNVDQGFMNWLAEIDPLSGFARQEYLNKAFIEFNAAHTATLFNAYKATKAPPAPAPAAPTPPARQQLQRQVAPDTSRVAANTPPSTSAKIWKTSEIDDYYRDVRKGKFFGKDAEMARIGAEIDQAVAEGRVR